MPSPAFGRAFATIQALSLLASSALGAISVTTTDPESIKSTTSQIAFNMMTYYTGNQSGQTPGLLPGSGTPTGYYWWEGGAMFGSLIHYWYLTGDATYNDVASQALLFQVGEAKNYEPNNETLSLGNDDQAFWALSAMSAAEYNFPNPPPDKPQWLALAQAVWARQQQRWDTQYCDGGLRWQIFNFNAGYNYKNAISNGCFFLLGARLGKYTGNQTYIDWADKTYDWMARVGLVDKDFNVFDGTGVEVNCTTVDHLQWTYNVGAMLYGAAAMWNITQSQKWHDRTSGLLKAVDVFLKDGVMSEIACEGVNSADTCNTDQKSFKAYLSRWMGATAQVAPWTYQSVFQTLTSSANAAAKACNAGGNGITCGLKWTTGAYDGSTGVGQQMAALEIMQTQLIQSHAYAGPLNQTLGTSVPDYSAGTGGDSSSNVAIVDLTPATTAEKAGAGILTILVGSTVIGGAVWMSF